MSSKNKPSKGLGDTIEKVTEFLGLKSAVESVFGEDCGCDSNCGSCVRNFMEQIEKLYENSCEN